MSAEGDRERLRRGFRFIRTFFATAPASDLAAFELAPGAEVQSDEAIDAWLRASLISAGHPVGTCAMGSVVGSDLKVVGVERLRVADASVMPNIVRGNTHAPTVMIAEKAADLIAGRASLPRVHWRDPTGRGDHQQRHQQQRSEQADRQREAAAVLDQGAREPWPDDAARGAEHADQRDRADRDLVSAQAHASRHGPEHALRRADPEARHESAGPAPASPAGGSAATSIASPAPALGMPTWSRRSPRRSE